MPQRYALAVSTNAITVVGMTCGHCAQAVRGEISKLPGVRSVEVDAGSGEVQITAEPWPDPATLRAAVEEAGYELGGLGHHSSPVRPHTRSMTSLPDNAALRGAAQRLRDGLVIRGLPRAMAVYFDPAEAFAGLTFTILGRNPRNEVTPDDLLAVSLLDIAWRPEAVRQLLDTDAEKVSGMLAAVRSDIDLWQASDSDLAAVDPLWDALLGMPGVGTATASKLLARKRPRLCPVSDKVVIAAAGVPGWTWESLRCLLQDPGARGEVEALRPPAAADASLLRILDVAIWICHSHSRSAHQLRQRAGIAEPGRAQPPDPARSPASSTVHRSRRLAVKSRHRAASSGSAS
jgi:copper chaperone CopZ